MPRVLPSQVVTVIDRMFPWAATQVDAQGSRINLGLGNSTQLAPIIALVELIPPELIILDSAHYAGFAAALAAIRNALQMWPARGDVFSLSNVPGFGELNPVTLVRRALAQCPDEAPSPQIAGLTFIADVDLRQNLRIDISEAYRAYADGSWKAATVLAGSVVEALLLWAIQQRSVAERTAAVSTLLRGGKLGRDPGTDPETWVLHDYIEVVHQLGRISAETASQSKLTKDFRNLIHPGRASRLGLTCDRGTALSALASVEHTIRELTP